MSENENPTKKRKASDEEDFAEVPFNDMERIYEASEPLAKVGPDPKLLILTKLSEFNVKSIDMSKSGYVLFQQRGNGKVFVAKLCGHGQEIELSANVCGDGGWKETDHEFKLYLHGGSGPHITFPTNFTRRSRLYSGLDETENVGSFLEKIGVPKEHAAVFCEVDRQIVKNFVERIVAIAHAIGKKDRKSSGERAFLNVMHEFGTMRD